MADQAPHRVSWAPKASRALRKAAESGGGRELARVARAVDERLSLDPLTFGEAYRSRGAVEERLAVLEFLAIDFAVDALRKFVLVRDCHFLSRPAADEPGTP